MTFRHLDIMDQPCHSEGNVNYEVYGGDGEQLTGCKINQIKLAGEEFIRVN